MNQQEYMDAYRINDRYFGIHPMDIAESEDDRLLQCIPYLPPEYRRQVIEYIRTSVPEFDVTFAQFNALCDRELNRFVKYYSADSVIDDHHADYCLDVPW